jgi:MFS family permease
MLKVKINNQAKWAIYCLTVLFLIFEMGVQVSPSVMTSQLMRDLHLNTFQLGLMSGFYFYTYTAMQIPSGLLFDFHNPRMIISTAILTCSLGALCFSFSINIYTAILARLLMGLGSAFAFISVLVVSADLFSHKYFALLTGITQMLAAIGAMMGQIPLSILVLKFGWRHVMIYIAVIGFLLTFLIWTFVNYERQEDIDIYSTKSVRSIFKKLKLIVQVKQTWLIGLYAFLLWAPMSGFTSLWGIPYLETAFNLTHTKAASFAALMWIGLAIASPLLGWFSTAIHRRILPLWLSAFVGLLGFAVVLFSPAHANLWMISIGILLAGAACAGQALSFSLIKDINSPRQKATAIAFNNMAVVISGAFFQPIIGKLLSAFHSHHIMTTSVYSINAFRYSLLLILLCYLFATILAKFFLKESYCRSIS